MFAAARPRNIDLRPTARTDIALRGWAGLRCRGGAFRLAPIFRGRPRSSTGGCFNAKILRGLS